MTSRERVSGTDADIDLIAMWRVVWSYKYLIIAVSAVCAIAAAALALTATQIYRAEVVVSEVSDQGLGGMAGLANQFGGLASLAGIDLRGSRREPRAILESRQLVEEFIRRRNLTPMLFPGAVKPPTLWFAVKKFRESIIEIRDDDGLIKIWIDWTDPQIATQWANEFVALANELVRTRDLDSAKKNIAYLEGQIDGNDVVELRNVMYKLIESEMKTLMLANGKADYAFTVVDPAVPPEIRISPRRTLMVLAGMVLGGLLGVILAFSLDALRKYRSMAVVAF
jgi:uncharacterized protein involved in exopolysaccharide biosynthesis